MADAEKDRNVLIVDDDEVMCELLTALMSVEGYDVSSAGSAEDALKTVQQGAAPGVILCDMRMPGMQGGDLAAALSAARSDGELPRTTVLLGMSGSAPQADEAKDFDGFLRKPFSVEEFARTVADIRMKGKLTSVDASTTAAQPSGNGSRKPALDERTFSQLRSKLGGGSLRELYGMMLDDVRERLAKIAAAAANGDSATVRREAHTIKGSCGMVGALELQELAAATEGGSPIDNSALANFDSACQRLRRMLDEKL
ncbi:MAG TPA: response regulator [Acidobacteriaceae bacterium]|nr:response regulator [Acidobacteriaceae bacterium]